MKIKALVMLAAMLPGQAFGLTALCVEDASTGFNWRNEAWVQTNFRTETYMLQSVDADDPRGARCNRFIAEQHPGGAPTEGAFVPACYTWMDVGTEATADNVLLCNEVVSNGTTISVNCTESAFNSFRAQVTGEFVHYRTYAIPKLFYSEGMPRDSVVMSVGKCSVVTR